MKLGRLVVFAAALTASTARAQYKLGDGTKLDRNLQIGSGSRNPAGPDFAAEVRFRNAIVTGNAPGGLSFRGDVGYRAPGEFLGSLGSNDQFAFRRDSVYSGLAGLGIRGTDALQYQFALTTGNAPPPGLTGSGVFPRSGGAPGIAPGRAGPPDRDAGAPVTTIAPGQPGADMRGTGLWLLRSPSAFVATRTIQPTLVTTLEDREGNTFGVTASALRGLAMEPMPGVSPASAESKVKLDAADGRLGATPRGGATETPDTTTPTLSEYERLLSRLAAPDKDEGKIGVQGAAREAGAKTPEWRQRLDALRRELEESRRDIITRAPGGDAGPGAAPTDRDRGDVLGLLRRVGEEPVTRLAPPGFDPYSVHMTRGQQFLSEGQFFFAEERFTSALNARPDDPMAAIGRVHAQLGASLYASAAVNLRRLFTRSPELIGARYDASLLPDADRARAIIDRLERLAAEGKGLGRETGLLVAYLGFQVGDRAAVERGLKTAGEQGSGPPDPALDTLVGVLRGVWAPPGGK